MTDVEARLAKAWADQAPAKHDALFRLAAMERLERRRLRGRIAAVVVFGVLFAACAAQLDVSFDAPTALTLSAAAAVSAAAWARRRMRA